MTGFAPLNEPWIRAFHRAADALRPTAERVREFAVSRGGERCLPMPYPLTIAQEDYDRLTAAAGNLLAAQTRIMRHLLETRSPAELLDMFALPAALGKYVDWDALRHGRDVIARFDVLPSGDRFWFCELNSDSSVWGYELYDCIAVYAQSLGWSLLRGHRSPAEDLGRILRAAARRRHATRAVLCDWSSYRGDGEFHPSVLFQHMRAALPDLDIHCLYENEYPQEWLTPGAGRQTIVFRYFMHDDMMIDGGAFYRRLVASGATIINTFETEFRTHKRWLALFFDERYRRLLSPQQLAAIDAYVPPTFTLTQSNLRDSIAGKDNYVFKLDREVGGAGVLIGADLSASELEATLRAHRLDRWVVQQYVEVDALPFGGRQSRMVLALYVIDGSATGMMVRASATSKVVNLLSGTATGTTWCVPMSVQRRQELLAELERLTR